MKQYEQVTKYKKVFKEAKLQGGFQADPVQNFIVKFLTSKQSNLEDLKGVELSEQDIKKIGDYFYFMFLNIIEIMPNIKSSKREGFLYKQLMSHQLTFETEMKKFKSEQLAKKGIEQKQLNDDQIAKQFIKSKNLKDEWFELFSRGSLEDDERGYVKMANEFFKQNNIPVKVINGLEQNEDSGTITWLVELKK